MKAWAAATTSHRGFESFHEEGEQVLSGVAADVAYDLVVESEDRVGAASAVRVGEKVTVRLERGLPLGGRLRRAGGAGFDRPPLAEAFALRPGVCFDLNLDDDGEFGEHVLPGRYEIRLVDSDGTVRVLARDVPAGRTDLEYVLR